MARPDWKAGDKLEVIEAFKSMGYDLPLGRVVEFIHFEGEFTVIQPTKGCRAIKWYTRRFKKIVAAEAAPLVADAPRPFLVGDKVHVINPRNVDANGKGLSGGSIRYGKDIPKPEDVFTIRGAYEGFASLNDAAGERYTWLYDYKSLKHVEQKEQKQMTFDEAYEQARVLRIVGRGSMNKAQLVAAIVAAKAAPAVKPAAPLAAPKPTLGEELRKSVGNAPGTCSYAMEWDNGHRRFQVGDVCHARMKKASIYESRENREKEDKATLIACALDVKGHYENADDKPAYCAWVDYFINHSPFAVAFKTKNVDEAMKEAVYMDVSQPNSYLVAAAIGLRQASEYPHRLAAWKQLVDSGFSQKAAHFMCHHLKDGLFYPDGGGHSPFTTSMEKDEFISFFKHGFKNTKEAPANKDFSNYRVFACIADVEAYYHNPKKKTLGKYLEGILKHKPVGYGQKQQPVSQRTLFAAMEQVEKDLAV